MERDGAGGCRSNGVCAFCALEEREQLKGGVYRNLQFLSPTQPRHLVNTTAQQVPPPPPRNVHFPMMYFYTQLLKTRLL